jgi:hypothetical protein
MLTLTKKLYSQNEPICAQWLKKESHTAPRNLRDLGDWLR